jgi:hypothetical protein
VTPEPPPVDAIDTPAEVVVTVILLPAITRSWIAVPVNEEATTPTGSVPDAICVEADTIPEVNAVPFGNVIEEVPTSVISVFVNAMLDAFVNLCWPTLTNVTAEDR